MHNKPNPTLIGSFIVGAIFLFVAGVLIFTKGQFLQETTPCIVTFQGSVKGLDIGAPVNFRGVRVGSVSNIILMMDQDTQDISIKTYLEIEQNKARTSEKSYNPKETYQRLLKKGLKAKLESQSMVTGKLFVELDFYPDEPTTLTGVEQGYLEIPSIPSDMEKLKGDLSGAIDKISSFPIEEIGENLAKTAENIAKLLDSSNVNAILKTIELTVSNLEAMIVNFDAQIKPLSTEAQATLKEFQQISKNANMRIEPLTASITSTAAAVESAFKEAEKTISLKEGKSAELADQLIKTAETLNNTLEQADQTLAIIQGFASEDSPLNYELLTTVKELGNAVRSLRVMADYLAQHPESLIQGKNE